MQVLVPRVFLFFFLMHFDVNYTLRLMNILEMTEEEEGEEGEEEQKEGA